MGGEVEMVNNKAENEDGKNLIRTERRLKKLAQIYFPGNKAP